MRRVQAGTGVWNQWHFLAYLSDRRSIDRHAVGSHVLHRIHGLEALDANFEDATAWPWEFVR